MSTITNEELAKAAKSGDTDALLSLWIQVQGFVIRQAQRWSGRGADKEDLRQAAFLALYEAVSRFDPCIGSFLAVYKYCLKSAFTTAICGGRSVRTLNDPLLSALSLDAPASSDTEESDPLGNLLPDESAGAAFDEIERRELVEAVRNALSVLDDEERQVVRLRFWNTLTQADAAQKMDLTEIDLKRIEASALRRLRQPQISKTLRTFL